MRDIKFRGKRIDNGEWFYGYYRKNQTCDGEILHFIYAMQSTVNEGYIVVPETVGQYTGVKDEYGNKIYEGDIVRYNEARYEVAEGYGSFLLYRDDNEIIDYSDFPLSIFPHGSDKMKFVGSKNDYCVSFYELADNQQDFEGSLDCEIVGNIHDNLEKKLDLLDKFNS